MANREAKTIEEVIEIDDKLIIEETQVKNEVVIKYYDFWAAEKREIHVHKKELIRIYKQLQKPIPENCNDWVIETIQGKYKY